MADADKRQRGLREVIIPMLGEETIMQSTIYKMGKAEGLEKGFEQGVELFFEQKLGRSLAAPERTTLGQRVVALGPKRLFSVGLELSPEALTTWLADPAAT